MTKTSRRLEDWIQRLGEHPLPVLASSRVACKALAQSGDAGVKDLATIVYRDPALAINLLHQANHLRHRHLDTRTLSVDQAVMMLGVQRTLELVGGMEDSATGVPPAGRTGYLVAAAHAYHTALQARAWAELRQDVLPAEIASAALVRCVGELAMWRMAPKALRAAEELSGARPHISRQAEYVVMGVAVTDISAGLVRLWRLPLLVLEHLVADKVSGRRTLGLALAHSLSRIAPLGWQHPAIDDLTETLAMYLGLDMDASREQIRIIAQRATESRAEELPAPWEPLLEPVEQPGDREPGGRAFCLLPRPAAARVLTSLCAQGADPRTLDDLKRKHAHVEPIDVPLNLALRALYHGHGLSRCIYLRLSRDRDSCKPYMAIGCEGDPNLTDLELDAAPQSFLGRQLQAKDASRLGMIDMEVFRKELPIRGRRLFSADAALIAPVRNGDICLGLVYADRMHADCAIDERAFTGFRQTVKALETGLRTVDGAPVSALPDE